MTYEYFIKFGKIFPLLTREFACWGNIFSWVWTNGGKADCLFKMCNRNEMPDSIARLWYLDDKITPRVYSFEELAYNERCFIDSGEGCIDEEGDIVDISNISINVPNIGIQYRDDNGVINVLPCGWGFDGKGSITFKGPNYSELEKQRIRK